MPPRATAKKTAATAKAAKRPMSDDHKTALAAGRDEGRKVRTYLEALENNRPKRGRKRTPESITARMAVIAERLPSAAPLDRLQLAQERVNLQRELDAMAATDDLSKIEADFVGVAKSYADRKGISHAAWREAGVPAAVLRQAGIA